MFCELLGPAQTSALQCLAAILLGGGGGKQTLKSRSTWWHPHLCCSGQESEEGGHEPWSPASPDVRRNRKPRVQMLEGHTGEERAQSEGGRAGIQDRQGKGRAVRSALGMAQHMENR